MELVEGEPIDWYCDSLSLSVEDRIDLFLQVCAAVDHAHRHLVVHRDLKPSNILVDADGRVRLLDFGIAKLTDPGHGEPGLTRAGGVALTPEYASPEQVRGEPVGIGTDVYSLGVVLYELLCGRRPYTWVKRSAAEIERVVCTTDPPRPSAAAVRGEGAEGSSAAEAAMRRRSADPQRLRRKLAGDLDAIVLKALEKEPERRYASVRELADDLQRHLAGLPVRARPARLAYRARKFVLRHRIPLAAAALVATALAAGGGIALHESRQARLQREMALRSANAMVFQLAEGLSRMRGPTEARLGLLTQATTIFEEIGRAGSASPEHRRQVADGYRVLSQTYWQLGDANRARGFIVRAEREARRLARHPRAAGADSLLLAGVLVMRGDVQASAGAQDSALAAFEEAMRLADGLDPEAAGKVEAHRVRYLAASRVADRLWEHSAETERAAGLYRKAYASANRLVELNRAEPQFLGFFATGKERLADVQYYAGRVGESCTGYREALGIRRRVRQLAAADPSLLRNHAVSMQNVGWCYDQEGRPDSAQALYGEANDLLRGLLRDDPSNVTFATQLMGGVGELGNSLRAQGRRAESLDAFRDAAAVGEGLRSRGVHESRLTWKTTQSLQLLANALVADGRTAEAVPVLGRARALLEELRARAPDNAEYARSLGDVLATEARIALARGDAPAALERYQEALGIRRTVAASSRLSQDSQETALLQLHVAEALERLGRDDEARKHLREARQALLSLRSAGQLSDTAEGYTRYLPAIERALARLGA
jgi:tetratricopeptide (TPR) repeat protein